MKRWGVILIILGLIIGLGGAGWFGKLIWRQNQYRKVKSFPISLKQSFRSDSIPVRGGDRGQVVVRMRLFTRDVKSTTTGAEKVRTIHHPQYQYPFEYVVKSNSNETLQEQTRPLKYTRGNMVDKIVFDGSEGGTVVVKHRLRRFHLPETLKTVQVSGQINPDRKFRSQFINGRVIVYDSIAEFTLGWVWSVCLMGAGVVIILVGLVIFIVGLIK
ncbi:MAG: hypothetical protein ABEJ65_06530 [bacterium]